MLVTVEYISPAIYCFIPLGPNILSDSLNHCEFTGSHGGKYKNEISGTGSYEFEKDGLLVP